MNTNTGRLRAAGLIAAGVVAGGVLAISGLASASTSSTPSNSGSTATSTAPAGPGGQKYDGIPGVAEHHGFGLRLTGTVTAIGTDSVTIKTSTGTATYTVDSASDIDKNGEATLANLVVGDAVRFSVNGTVIDKLHAGDEAKDRPAGMPRGPISPGGSAEGLTPPSGGGTTPTSPTASATA